MYRLFKTKTTFIGTVKSNKRDLPSLSVKQKTHESLFFKNENGFLLTVYRNVLFISIHHKKAEIEKLNPKKSQLRL